MVIKWQTVLLFFLWAVGIALFVVLGALIFEAFEYEDHWKSKEMARFVYDNFITNHTDISMDQLVEVVRLYKQGYFAKPDEKTAESDWDLANSLFFCVSVITTIGYGNLTPQTTGGRSFFVVYALFGIPLGYAFLYKLGKELNNVHDHFIKKINLTNNPQHNKYIQVTITTVFTVVGFFILPSLIFELAEDDWDYGVAMYFSVNSLTTLGFGDEVAGFSCNDDKWYKWYRLFTMVWLIMGLAWVLGLLGRAMTGVDNTMDEKFKLAEDWLADFLERKKSKSPDDAVEPDETTPILEKSQEPKENKIEA